MKHEDLGWTAFFSNQVADWDLDSIYFGRVACLQKGNVLIYSDIGEKWAKLSGKFSHDITHESDYPVVGDWVAFTWDLQDDYAMIQLRLDRKTCLKRIASGRDAVRTKASLKEQIMAANIDTVFIVSGLDRDFNPRRIERYLTMVYDSGSIPVVLLNKSDMCSDTEIYLSEVESIAIGVPVICISAKTGLNFESLGGWLTAGQTVALLGSSGVGKSSIINRLLGEERQKVTSVSTQVGKGVHTTTARELIPLPGGGIVIDTPGMRELQLSDSGTGIAGTFDDIERIAETCRFSDCTHENEPGCAIRHAIEEGEVARDRFEGYKKLVREQRYHMDKQEKTLRQIEKDKWRKIKIMHRKQLKMQR